MGIFFSKPSPDEILNQITEISKSIIDTYGVFVDTNTCDKLSVIYENELRSFRKQELNGVSMLLGLTVPNEKVNKAEICQRIVDHYNKRITLISTISSSLSFCGDRIKGLKTGPRCMGKPDVFEKDKCPTNWVDTLTAPDANISENSLWYDLVNAIVNKYGDGMADLLEIVIKLRDFDESIDDDSLVDMTNNATSLIEDMHKICYEKYQLALTTPTFSQGEIDLKNEQKKIAESESNARMAALRTAHGLTAVQSK